MSLEITDTGLAPGITIKKAIVAIDYHVVNPGTPIEQKNKAGEVTGSTKTYNVNLFLNYRSPENGEVYRKFVVSINGLLEEELNFKTYYTRLKEFEPFDGAKDV